MSIAAAIKGASTGVKIIGALVPMIVLPATFWVSSALTKRSLSAQHKVVVDRMELEFANQGAELSNTRTLYDQCVLDKSGLESKVSTLETARLEAAEARVALMQENQRATTAAVSAASAAASSNNRYFNDLAEQLKDVRYETSCEAGDLRIVGGGIVLRNAAKGADDRARAEDSHQD